MLNIIYAGTPDVAVPPLDYLANLRPWDPVAR